MLIGALAQYFFGFTIFVLSAFLVLLVLVQRGRGGGLTGALGGPGGQSAFGTKAGDLFTRITVGVAAAWILLCATAVFMLRNRGLPETGISDRPTASSSKTAGAGATSGMTDTGANSSAMPPIDLSNLSKTPLPDVKSTALPSEETKTPAAVTPAVVTPAVVTPGAESTAPSPAGESTTPAAPALNPPAADPVAPPLSTGTETPPAPK